MSPEDPHVHALALAQLTADAEALDRLDVAYARLERRVDRIAASLAIIEDGPVPALPVSPGQLRLAAG